MRVSDVSNVDIVYQLARDEISPLPQSPNSPIARESVGSSPTASGQPARRERHRPRRSLPVTESAVQPANHRGDGLGKRFRRDR